MPQRDSHKQLEQVAPVLLRTCCLPKSVSSGSLLEPCILPSIFHCDMPCLTSTICLSVLRGSSSLGSSCLPDPAPPKRPPVTRVDFGACFCASSMSAGARVLSSVAAWHAVQLRCLWPLADCSLKQFCGPASSFIGRVAGIIICVFQTRPAAPATSGPYRSLTQSVMGAKLCKSIQVREFERTCAAVWKLPPCAIDRSQESSSLLLALLSLTLLDLAITWHGIAWQAGMTVQHAADIPLDDMARSTYTSTLWCTRHRGDIRRSMCEVCLAAHTCAQS